MEEKEHLCTVDGNVWKHLEILENIKYKYRTSIWSRSPTSGYFKEIKTRLQTGICTPMFIAAASTIAKMYKQLSINGWMDTHTNGILFSHQEEENLPISDNMDGTWGHCAKWNKSDKKKRILHDIT